MLIGGWGERTLRLAAEHADIIGLTGATSDREGNLSLVDAAGWRERTEFVRTALGERAKKVELNVLVQTVVSTDDRAGTLERLRAYDPHLTAEELAELPTLLVGTPHQIAEQLREHRERYGLGYLTVLEPNLDTFAPVIELLR